MAVEANRLLKRQFSVLEAILVTLENGDIPSVRSVAKTLGITHNMVYRTIIQLEGTGHLRKVSNGAGMYVYLPGVILDTVQDVARKELDRYESDKGFGSVDGN